MCTVTYIPTSKGVYLTSNRDENINRVSASPPRAYDREGLELIFPRDEKAGGSWIVLKPNGDAAVLLNGAFNDHQRLAHYRKSRGVILLDLFSYSSPVRAFTSEDLNGIEPFTLILFINRRLWECRWDGSNKHALQLNHTQPYIWSSSTLYNPGAVKLRRQWFLEWFSSTSPVTTAKIIRFHQEAGKHDPWNGLVINRNHQMRTVSISSVFSSTSDATLQYIDLKNNSESSWASSRSATKAPQKINESIYWSLKKWMIRFSHWEYWPDWLLYGPLIPYWLWLSIRSRSLLFFSAANPGIENAGFIQERKSNIYKIIPAELYPETKRYKAGTAAFRIKKAMEEQGWTLPVVAKPDIGEKGKQVKLISTIDQLTEYANSSRVDFLLQRYVSYPNEAGIFYYRIPGEEKGHISGIVGKELLAVTGDGHSTIESLIRQNNRFLLQLQSLRKIHGPYLQTILGHGVSVTLSPYGNHARGAKFIDQRQYITPALTETIDQICRNIPGFFYGRLDIRFNSWEELARGEKFSIIELNGAGSEPTHIYDPSHSVFFAWKEICRHWKLLRKISMANVRLSGTQLIPWKSGIRLIRERIRYLKLLIEY